MRLHATARYSLAKTRDRGVNAESTIVLHDGILVIDSILGPLVLLCVRSCAFDYCSSLAARHFDTVHTTASVLFQVYPFYMCIVDIETDMKNIIIAAILTIGAGAKLTPTFVDISHKVVALF